MHDTIAVRRGGLPQKKVNFIGKSIILFQKSPPRGHSYSYQTKAKEQEGGGLGNG
jgi:hypothetical protein